MEFPSMVERTGDRLVVRNLFNNTAMYQMPVGNNADDDTGGPEVNLPLLAQEAEWYQDKPAAEGELPQLPQCKIRRNYSCGHCAFFTQNPRSHLSHLRDVHGERISINECKLCLYASRHFQKLVRHMKMVHGCTDKSKRLPGEEGQGQGRGKRNISREALKRRLEESIVMPRPAAAVAEADDSKGISPRLVHIMQNGPSLEQLKTELKQQEQDLLAKVQAYNRQQEMLELQKIVANGDNIFSMAFELQRKMMTPTPDTNDSVQMDFQNNNSSSDSEGSSPTNEEAAMSNDPKKYQCQKCSYSTPIRARFKKHVKYHSMPLIKCDLCDFHSPYKWNLDRHTKNHGAAGHFKCSLCDFSTDIKQSLTIHELNHHVPAVGHPTRRRAAKELEGQLDLKPSSSKKHSPSIDASLELTGITCSHCKQLVPSAMELVKHLQLCPPALANTKQLLATCLPSQDVAASTEEDYPAPASDVNYSGVETAPGYGEVTEPYFGNDANDSTPMKKVFKCPHCTFWAATASRFHVHIVGHLNRKPFECSLCSYRSNWRWDITKHIRLKTNRDKSHNQARVLMNDETGRRNYTKYNQYLTLMKVIPSTEDFKAARTAEQCDPMTEMMTEEGPPKKKPPLKHVADMEDAGDGQSFPRNLWDTDLGLQQPQAPTDVNESATNDEEQ
ncbi:PR domain zinc finger protein 5 [Drosophila subobscura]|uniref:PR domain zinc finger protein 5 n=1 Tax=Drosophila subobscura TaxID=7241 RepID=UPI00155A33CA|nr:PR domain zinc finger protein 5 [Drosophila subobscura]XP_034666092.1 PR domain zinc finger protein 5 [Drosophila subobscura]